MSGNRKLGLSCKIPRNAGLCVFPFLNSRWHSTASTLLVLLVLLFPLNGWTETPDQPPLATQSIPGSSSRGEMLFAGRIPFRNQGPACIACHSIGGLSFPNGGTLGPDLTHAYTSLGQPGAQAALHSLYFGVMTPIYDQHPLVPSEQADLLAFLQQSAATQQPQWITQSLLLVALVLAGIFLIITAMLWRRRRVYSVRETLVNKVRQQEPL